VQKARWCFSCWVCAFPGDSITQTCCAAKEKAWVKLQQVPSRRALAQPCWWAAAAWHHAAVTAVLILQEQPNFGWAPWGASGLCRGTACPSPSTAGAPGTPMLPWPGSGSSPCSAPWKVIVCVRWQAERGWVLPVAPELREWPLALAPHYQIKESALPWGTPCEPHRVSPALPPTCQDQVVYLRCCSAFLTFSEESRWGSQHLQYLINAKRYQGMRLLREAEQMCWNWAASPEGFSCCFVYFLDNISQSELSYLDFMFLGTSFIHRAYAKRKKWSKTKDDF